MRRSGCKTQPCGPAIADPTSPLITANGRRTPSAWFGQPSCNPFARGPRTSASSSLPPPREREKGMRHDGGGACEGRYGQFAAQISHTVRWPSYGGSRPHRGAAARRLSKRRPTKPCRHPDDTARLMRGTCRASDRPCFPLHPPCHAGRARGMQSIANGESGAVPCHCWAQPPAPNCRAAQA